MEPAIFSADGCVCQIRVESLEIFDLFVSALEVSIKTSIDLDILDLVADPIYLINLWPFTHCHPVRSIAIRYYAMDAISVKNFECLSVDSLTKAEHLQGPRFNEVRVDHKADLGRQLEEDGIRPQQWD